MILCKKSPSISSLWIPYGSCSNYLWKDNYLSDKANGKKETGNLGERKHSWGWQRGSACGFPRSLSCQVWAQVFKLQKRDFGARMTKKHELNWCHESWSPSAVSSRWHWLDRLSFPRACQERLKSFISGLADFKLLKRH